MSVLSNRRRAVYVLLLLLFFTSCKSPCHKWSEEYVDTCNPIYNSGRIYITPEDTFGGLELEIARGFDLRMYINVYSIQIAPDSSDSTDCSYAKLQCCIEGESYEGYGRILRGNQRVLLEDEDTQRIICALKNGFDVEITLGRYKSVIPARGFSEGFSSLMNIRAMD